MFKGSIVALVTPFTKENKIDLEALTKLINWHIDSKTDGIVICGTTGEGPAVSDEEKLLMLKLTTAKQPSAPISFAFLVK